MCEGREILEHAPDLDLVHGRQYVCLSIKDNGVGFDPKYKEKIFDVFRRLHVDDNYPGTGIGLAIVRRVAENHGGAVNATSEPNKGTTFYIYLRESPDAISKA